MSNKKTVAIFSILEILALATTSSSFAIASVSAQILQAHHKQVAI
jgi:hypothetical protein